MRILIVPTYEQPAFLLGDSSYLLMNQFVQIASKQDDVFLYWLLPDAATDDGDTGGYLKIVDPNLPTERDKSELYMPACLADFNPIDGKYPIDVVLTNNAGKAAALNLKVEMRGQAIRICSLNAGTGLEGSIVFLVGMHKLNEQEQSLRVSEEEKLKLIRDNTRKLHTAITRAGQRLVITYAGEIPDVFRIAAMNPQSI